MEQWDADRIARKLATSWSRSSISADSWADELLPLVAGPAEEAVRRLVRTAEHAPSIAQFHGTYRGLLGTVEAGDACPDCAGSGLVTDTNHPRHWPGDRSSVPVLVLPDGPHPEECMCNVVRPCSCRIGQSSGARLLATIRGDSQIAAA